MNIIKLYGGLGNQMFQYALGKTMESLGLSVAYEISFFNKPQDPPRPLRINKFRTSLKISPFLSQPTIHEKDYYNFDPALLTMKDFNFMGYWQHQGYIERVFPTLKQEFLLLQGVCTEEYFDYKEQIVCKESVAIHIRRGDYVRINGHVVEPMEYYEKALSKVQGNLFIFSDDLSWCRANFKNAIFVDLEDYLAFDLFRRCKYQIIANSTFSLWAALLGSAEVVINPSQWRESLEEQTKLMNGGLIKDNWIRI